MHHQSTPLTRPRPAQQAGIRPLALAAALALGVLSAVPVRAGVFGSLGNFDVVNDTGGPTYGFEIDIEDSHYRAPDDPLYDPNYRLTSVFGLDRDFGLPGGPAGVVRYGAPTVSYDLPGGGVRIRYGGTVGSVFTPSGSFAYPGDSCWPGSGLWSTAAACDHFGVATTSSPTRVSYYWLQDGGGGAGSTASVLRPAGLPPVIIAQPQALPQQPAAAPQMVVVAPDLGGVNQDNAFWVKIVKTTLDENVALIDLLGGNHPGARPEIAALHDAPEVETEWQPLQIGMVDEVTKVLDAPKPSVVYMFQFFKYQGRFDDDGYIDPVSDQFPQVDADGNVFVMLADGRHDLSYAGQQIAGFNANELAAAVPEPGSWSLLAAGLGLLGWRARRSTGR